MTVSPQRLADSASFANLSLPARQAVEECARRVEFGPGQRLIPLGQPPQRLLILTEGLAKLVGVSIGGHERILKVYRPPDIVGPGVLMESIESELEVAAMSCVRALAISRRDLLIVSRSHPSLIMALAREVSRQLLSMTERLMTVTTEDVPIRLSQLLLDLADSNGADREAFVPLTYPLTHESMAQIVGASRPHTSTVLRDLEGRGAVRRGSRSKLLVRPSRLESILKNGRLDHPVRRGSLALSA